MVPALPLCRTSANRDVLRPTAPRRRRPRRLARPIAAPFRSGGRSTPFA